MKNYTLLFLLFLGSYAISQNKSNPRHIKEILSTTFSKKTNGKSKSFKEITREADAFFKLKYPNKTAKQLAVGEYRDGDFVKYERWKRYWKYRLNDDGTLGSVLKAQNNNKAYKTSTSKLATCNDSDFDVSWTGVNYNGNLGFQIDMGRVNALGFHPTDANTYIVGAAFGGLWKTTDGGQTYVNLNDDLPHTSIADIIIDKENTNRIFVALSDIVWYGPTGIGIYESTDGGQTFSPTNLTFSLPQNVRIYEMDVNPNNSSEFLVATSNGLYRTTNYFSSSNLVIDGSMASVKYNLNSNNAHAGGNNGEYFLSTNSGQSFSYNNDFGRGQVRISVSNKTNSGYVAITNDNVLNISSDFGQNFTQKPTMPERNSVVAFANNSDSNILLGNFNCFRSTNSGNSYQSTSHWLGNNNLPVVHVDQRNIYTNPLQSDYVYYCNDGGVFRYSVSNNSFTNLSTGLFITQYYDIAVSQTDANVLGAGSQDNGNVTRNSNGVWQSYEPTADGMGQEIDFNNPSTRYYSIQHGGLRRWDNGTLNYIAPRGQDGNGAWETPFKLDPNNSNRIIIGYKSVYASDNKGNSWTNIGNNISGGNLEQIAIAKSNSNRIYASRFNTVYAKNSNNNSWTNSTSPVNQNISDLEVHPVNENTIYISYGGFTSNGKVYKSTNAGANWENISFNLPNVPILSLETYDDIPGSIFVGTYNGVYFLNDGATTWEKYGCLPNTSVNDIEIQYINGAKKIFIGTHGRGIFEAPIVINNDGNNNDDNNNDNTCNATITPYVNDGSTWLQQDNLEVCEGTDILIGMQDVGTTNVELKYPDGTIDDTPDRSTAWQFNNVQTSAAGVYTIFYDNGTCTVQKDITLTVNAKPVITPYVNDGSKWLQQDNLEVCKGKDILIGMQDVGTTNVELKYPDGTIDDTPDLSTAWQFNNVQKSDAGVYTVFYDNGTCIAQKDITLTVNNNCGFNWWWQFKNNKKVDLDYSIMSVYPNPVNKELTISNSFNLSDFKVSIIDLRGRLVKDNVGVLENEFKISVDMSKIENGIYFLMIIDSKSKYRVVRQIIKN